MFRDWLRSHAADRDLYAQTKLALVQQNWKYVQNYATQRQLPSRRSSHERALTENDMKPQT